MPRGAPDLPDDFSRMAAKSKPCDRPGCDLAGEHRAPRARQQSDGYYWFCLQHAREYNAAWNYHAGMSTQEIDRMRKDDVTWGRPTWRLGGGAGIDFNGWNVHDDLGIFSTRWRGRTRANSRPDEPTTTPEQRKALATLGLDPPSSHEEIKGRYKELVRRYHPDANGGNRRMEDRLKRINAAYAALMARKAP